MNLLRTVACVLAALLMPSCESSAPLTPLIGAARDGDAAAIGRLLREGADPNLRGGVNDWTPLMHAIHKNRLESLQALLAGHADVNAASRVGETPLMMAAGYGNAAAVRILLDAGADSRREDSDGKAALDYAVAGVPDIDDFTVGTCQTSAVEALLRTDPGLTLVSGGFGRAERVKMHVMGCAAIARLIDRKP